MTESKTYSLGDLTIDVGARRVRRNAEDLPLPKRSFDMLVALVRSYPNALSVDELMSRVWGRAVVNPSTVAKRVQLLRKALGDDHDDPRYVQLVRGHGYRLGIEPEPGTGGTTVTDPRVRPARLIALAAGAAIAVAAMLFFLGQGEWASDNAVPERSVVILPFVSLSGEAEDELFADGLTEELSHVLANHPQLKVTGRTSAFYYKNRNEDLRDIGRTLGVAHVLEGAVRRDSNGLRVTAQLIETNTGFHLWSEAYNHPLASLVEVQQDIASNVAAALRASLELDFLPAQPWPESESHAAYLQALQLSKPGDNTDLGRALAILEGLTQREPDYAAAWSLLAAINLRRLLGNHEAYPYSWQESWDRVRDAVDKALEHGPETGATRVLQGAIEWLYKHDTAAGAAHFEAALALAPGDLDVVQTVARFANRIGRLEVALPLHQYLVDRDPLCARCQYLLGKTYWYSRRYDEAEAAFRQYQRLAEGGGERSLGVVLLLGGQPALALESFRELDHHLYLRLQGEAMALHALGDAAAAEEVVQQLVTRWGDEQALAVAQTYAYMDQKSAAFEWLARAGRRDRENLRMDFADPLFDPLRDDPRWDGLLAGLGIAPAQLALVEFAPDLSRFQTE